MNSVDTFWWYVTLKASTGLQDTLMSVVEESGCIGAEDLGRGDFAELRAYYDSTRDLGGWLEVLNSLLDSVDGDVQIADMGKVENRPWHTEWMDAFPPLDVGETFVVMAPWHRGKDELPKGKIPIYIHPRTAFGTGYHESTQSVLSLLERHLKKGDVVADIGCGSCILAIGALKLGASMAYARDLDESVIEEALDNAVEENGIDSSMIDVAQGDLLKGFDHKVDVLMANILKEPLLAMLPDVRGVLKKGGRAIFSGMLEKEGEDFKSYLPKYGLKLTDEIVCGEWCGLVAEADV